MRLQKYAVPAYAFGLLLLAAWSFYILFPGWSPPLEPVAEKIIWTCLFAAALLFSARGLLGVDLLNLSPFLTFVAMLLYGPVFPAVLLALSSVYDPLRFRDRSRALSEVLPKISFNMGKDVLSVTLAAWMLLRVTGLQYEQMPASLEMVTPLLVAGLVAAHLAHFGIDTFGFAVLMRLRSGTGIWQFWRNAYGWRLVSSFGVPLLGYFVARLFLGQHYILAALFLPVFFLIRLPTKYHQQLREVPERVVKTLLQAQQGNLDAHAGEADRVRDLAVAVGRRSGLSTARLDRLGLAASLRDVGLLVVDREILGKPGKLNEDETKSVRAHVELGARMVSRVPILRDVAAIILAHHERPDGKGYPRGLTAEQIPPESAIVHCVEAFVSLTSPRPHRAPLSEREALERLALEGPGSVDDRILATLGEMHGTPDLIPPERAEFRKRRRWRWPTAIPRGVDFEDDSAPAAASVEVAEEPESLGPLRVALLALMAAVCLGTLPLFVTSLPPLSLTLMWAAVLLLASLAPIRVRGTTFSATTGIVVAAALLHGPGLAVPLGLLSGVGILARRGGNTAPRSSVDGRSSVHNRRSGKCRGWIPGHHAGIQAIERSLVLATSATVTGSLIALPVGAVASVSALLAILMFTASEVVLGTLFAAGANRLPFWRQAIRSYGPLLPEPLGFAFCGMLMAGTASILGEWAIIPLTWYPLLWRRDVVAKQSAVRSVGRALLGAIVTALDAKDAATAGHSQRVGNLATRLARHLRYLRKWRLGPLEVHCRCGLSEAEIDRVYDAGILHDVGKTVWSGRTLRAPRALTEEEKTETEWHPLLSAAILERAGLSRSVVAAVRLHHTFCEAGEWDEERCLAADLLLLSYAVAWNRETDNGEASLPLCPMEVASEALAFSRVVRFALSHPEGKVRLVVRRQTKGPLGSVEGEESRLESKIKELTSDPGGLLPPKIWTQCTAVSAAGYRRLARLLRLHPELRSYVPQRLQNLLGEIRVSPLVNSLPRAMRVASGDQERQDIAEEIEHAIEMESAEVIEETGWFISLPELPSQDSPSDEAGDSVSLPQPERPSLHSIPADEFPLAARVLCVADSIDAMLSGRPYRPGWSYQEVGDELARCSGTQFDPDVVEFALPLLSGLEPGLPRQTEDIPPIPPTAYSEDSGFGEGTVGEAAPEELSPEDHTVSTTPKQKS